MLEFIRVYRYYDNAKGIRPVNLAFCELSSTVILESINPNELIREYISFESIHDLDWGTGGSIFSKYRTNIQSRKVDTAQFFGFSTKKRKYGFECNNMKDFYQITGMISRIVKMNALNQTVEALSQQVSLLSKEIMALKEAQSKNLTSETPKNIQPIDPLDDSIYNAMYC